MSLREQMQPWVLEAVNALGGAGEILEVAKHVWATHEQELIDSGDAFFSWQCEMRWAADQLRKSSKLGFHKKGSRSVWVLQS